MLNIFCDMPAVSQIKSSIIVKSCTVPCVYIHCTHLFIRINKHEKHTMVPIPLVLLRVTDYIMFISIYLSAKFDFKEIIQLFIIKLPRYTCTHARAYY